MKLMHKGIRWMFAGLIGMVLLVGPACAPMKKQKTWDDDGEVPYKFQKKEKTFEPLYYDFKDVLVPGELREEKKYGSVIYSSGMTTGFNAFYGRVDITSLTVFFNINMPKDRWMPVSLFKASDMTIMLFHKENRWCVINMMEKGFSTEVKIGVAPALNKVMLPSGL